MDKPNSILENIKEQNESGRNAVISQLGIFELRGLGRELGVQSPTTRKRDELVALIMEKLNSNITEAPKRTSRKGRPVKTLNNLGQIMSAMTGGEESNSFPSATKRIRPYDEVVSFAQETPVFSLLDQNETRAFDGVFRLSSKVGYFLDIKDRLKVFVPMDMIKKHNLQTGDYLQVSANKMNSANQFIVAKIKTINFVDAAQYSAITSKKAPIISFDKLAFGDFGLFVGRRNLIEYNHDVYEDERFVKFAKSLIAQGYRIVALGLNTSFEDSIMLSSMPKVINLCTKYAESVQAGLDKVVDAISLVQRLADMGEKVVLFVIDIVEVLNTLDLCFEEREKIMGHTSEAVVIVQKLISSARVFDDGSQVTLAMTYRDINSGDNFLVNEIFKIANKF